MDFVDKIHFSMSKQILNLFVDQIFDLSYLKSKKNVNFSNSLIQLDQKIEMFTEVVTLPSHLRFIEHGKVEKKTNLFLKKNREMKK